MLPRNVTANAVKGPERERQLLPKCPMTPLSWLLHHYLCKSTMARECPKEEDPRSAAVATAAMIVAVTAANLVVVAAIAASRVAAAAVTSVAAHAAVTAAIAVHAAAIAAARNRNHPIKYLKRSTH